MFLQREMPESTFSLRTEMLPWKGFVTWFASQSLCNYVSVTASGHWIQTRMCHGCCCSLTWLFMSYCVIVLCLCSASLSLCIYLYITRGESRFLPHALTNLHSLITRPSLYCAACFFDVLQIPLPAPFVNELISVAGGGGEVVGGGKWHSSSLFHS